MKNLCLLILCLPLLACAQSTTKTDADKEITRKKAILKKNMVAFSQALMNQDYDTVVDAYTEDAKIFPRNSKILAGKDAIRKYWTPPVDSKRRTTYHKIMPEEIKILGKEAYDYGYYEGKSIGNDGKESSWGGKYVITWKEVEPDIWKMYLDIWN